MKVQLQIMKALVCFMQAMILRRFWAFEYVEYGIFSECKLHRCIVILKLFVLRFTGGRALGRDSVRTGTGGALTGMSF